ncbi:AMP-binding protein [Nocardia sp. NPDC050406]|uniref:non-ribosomal peptide synthetase n=1 Tax=Nocardia sp. NPDC050406 TaxID=3364318 RepID=UPI00379C844B
MAEQWAWFMDRFDEVVRRHPDAVAVDAHDAVWTFAMLAEQVERLAERLCGNGIRPGDVVGLRTGRSAWHVAALLAVWRSRAAFVPFDPDAPERRIQLIIREARCRAVLVGGASGLEIVSTDVANTVTASTSQPPNSTAYIIYTSGSTGEPKGVRVGHAGLVPMLTAQIDLFGLGLGKRALCTLSTAFDASLSDIGTALLSAATLVIPRDPATASTLTELLRTHRITHADLPPSLLTFTDPETLPATLETVVIGGEICPPATVRAWASVVRLINVYGPTEATICTSMGLCDTTWDRPLLGTPLPHVDYALVDGELLIGGPAVALGYIDRPALEQRRFVLRGGRHWYRTGDLVRQHSDGTWEFLGRADRQLKFRGRLICPEEIEARLRDIDGVAESAVVAIDGVLTAQVRPSDATVRASTIRDRLATTLPSWMLPRVVLVADLPRNHVGKIDLRRVESELDTRSSRTSDARRIQVITAAFTKVLGVHARPHDDFQLLGGDSLAAIRIVAEAALHGMRIEPTALLTARTPHAIARAPRTGHRTVAELDAAAARHAAETTTTPIGSGTGTDWLLTGATGYLGGHLLPELLARTDATIHCLVRADNDGHARARLEALAAHPRIRVYSANIAAPQLGLSDTTWLSLANRVGKIVHAAATLSLGLPYSELAAINVRGAVEIARFARRSGARMHHISTLAVLAATDSNIETLDEHTRFTDTTHVVGGYPQSKWIAEKLLRHSVPHLSVIRPGLLTGHSLTGMSGPTCPLTAFLRTVAEIGCLPTDNEDRLRVNITPVDHAATVIADLISRAPVPMVHVAGEHGATLRELRSALGEFVRIEPVTSAEFLRRARERLTTRDALALIAASYRLTGADEHRDADLFLHTGRRFPTTVLRAATGTAIPPADPELLTRYVEFALRASNVAQTIQESL